MRSPRTLLTVAGLLLAVSVVLLVTASGRDGEYGWIAYAPESDFGSVGSSVFVLTRQQVLGWIAAWLATLLTAGVIGHRIASRRPPGGQDD
jgi:heme/copper-type cytochrome/quinol oxidase subunit 1